MAFYFEPSVIICETGEKLVSFPAISSQEFLFHGWKLVCNLRLRKERLFVVLYFFKYMMSLMITINWSPKIWAVIFFYRYLTTLSRPLIIECNQSEQVTFFLYSEVQ